MNAYTCLSIVSRARSGFQLAATSLLVLAACQAPAAEHAAKASDDELAAAVWSAVEARNTTWLENDFAGHMALYHPDFRRWSLRAPRLMTRDGFANLWDTIKSNEAARTLEVEPEELLFYADGSVAVAHYTIRESWEWIGEDREAGPGRSEARKGDLMTGALRFSDVWVREDDAWLYVGGHRDGMGLEP